MVNKQLIKFSCKNCNKGYFIPSTFTFRLKRTKYCSRICANTCIAKRPNTWGKKIGDKLKGKKRPDLSLRNKLYPKSGPQNGNWKGGITPDNLIIRSSNEYKLWRESVFLRDNFTCQFCGKRGGEINADHIKQFAFFPELRLSLDNGRTLCVECHRKTFIFTGNQYVESFHSPTFPLIA